MSTAVSPARRSRVHNLTRRLGLDPFEAACLVVLAGISLVVLVPLSFQGRPLSGVEGLFPPDQFQYFAWIREAAHHGLIGNRFDLAPGERPFLHPGFGLSGLLHDVTGVSIPLAYQAWKPLAVGPHVRSAACSTSAGSCPPAAAGGPRSSLALFSVMPAVAVVAWTDWGGNPRQYTFDFISGEMWTGQYLWGYLMTAIAVFLMPLILLGIESWRSRWPRPPALALRARHAGRVLAPAVAGGHARAHRRRGGGAPLAAHRASARRWRCSRSRRPPRSRPSTTSCSRTRTRRGSSPRSRTRPAPRRVWSWPWWAIVLTVFPLALPAALAYRLPAPTWQDQAVRIWPLAALAVYLLPLGTFPYHAFQGLALPLSILAVAGATTVIRAHRAGRSSRCWRCSPCRASSHKLELPRNNIRANVYAYYILHDEQRALDWLEDDPRPGGVLAAEYASNLVPYQTGRETYLGPSPGLPTTASAA